jgi:hypothetical protein
VEEVEASRLRRQVGSATYGADFDGGHGASNVQIVTVVGTTMMNASERLTIQPEGGRRDRGSVRLHDGETVGALDVLGRILSGGNENGRDDVGRMCVEAAWYHESASENGHGERK